eukprot:jgi/Botrbrau1/23440/Bobra.106_1s0001.1
MAEDHENHDVKPDNLDNTINIKVRGQDQTLLQFKAKRTTQFRKLFKAYCERQSVSMDAVVFLHEGTRVRAEQTPEELDMEDNETLDVMVSQIGGDMSL